jgi:hypothetical protein
MEEEIQTTRYVLSSLNLGDAIMSESETDIVYQLCAAIFQPQNTDFRKRSHFIHRNRTPQIFGKRPTQFRGKVTHAAACMTFMTKVLSSVRIRPVLSIRAFSAKLGHLSMYESILEEFERRTFIQAQWEETFDHLELNT